MTQERKTFFYRCFNSSLVAFAGLVYEFLLAYLLSLTLGNTFLRFAITVGLFTLTLGISALAFDHLPEKFKSNFYFLLLQGLIALVAFVSPYWIQIMDPLSYPASLRDVFVFLSHAPILLIGLLTGLELPFLFYKAEPRHFSLILAFDYLGMFLAALIYPLVLFPLFGIFVSLYLTLAVNIGVALICWRMKVIL